MCIASSKAYPAYTSLFYYLWVYQQNCGTAWCKHCNAHIRDGRIMKNSLKQQLSFLLQNYFFLLEEVWSPGSLGLLCLCIPGMGLVIHACSVILSYFFCLVQKKTFSQYSLFLSMKNVNMLFTCSYFSVPISLALFGSTAVICPDLLPLCIIYLLFFNGVCVFLNFLSEEKNDNCLPYFYNNGLIMVSFIIKVSFANTSEMCISI